MLWKTLDPCSFLFCIHDLLPLIFFPFFSAYLFPVFCLFLYFLFSLEIVWFSYRLFAIINLARLVQHTEASLKLKKQVILFVMKETRDHNVNPHFIQRVSGDYELPQQEYGILHLRKKTLAVITPYMFAR